MGWARVADGVLRRTQRAFRRDPVVYTPPAGPPVTLADAVFRETTEQVTPEGVQVLVEEPNLAVALADLPDGRVAEGALVELADGRSFRVVGRDFDGEGGAMLRLHEVAA